MNFRVTHTTRYDYGGLATINYNEAWLTPRTFPGQTCIAADVHIDPQPHDRSGHIDFFGNQVTYFSVQQPHERMSVTARCQVQLDPSQRSIPEDIPVEEARNRLQTPRHSQARPFVLGSPLCAPSAALADYARISFPPGTGLLEGAADLMSRIHTDYEYVPQYTSIATPLQQLLSDRRGVCQDFAHVAIGCLRSLGLAARYVSGYIETLSPEGQPRLRGADASHAWFSVLVPDESWVDFDPTNDQQPSEQHVTVAWGRDYADVPPLKGVVIGNGDTQMSVGVDVERVTS